jgi:hypothetical protein
MHFLDIIHVLAGKEVTMSITYLLAALETKYEIQLGKTSIETK